MNKSTRCVHARLLANLDYGCHPPRSDMPWKRLFGRPFLTRALNILSTPTTCDIYHDTPPSPPGLPSPLTPLNFRSNHNADLPLQQFR